MDSFKLLQHGQTLFNGIDDNGKRIIFNDNSVRVFVNGVEKVHYTDFTFKNDRVTFTSGQTAGHVVEIYTDFNNILYEDGDRIQLNTTESHIRNVTVTSRARLYFITPMFSRWVYLPRRLNRLSRE